MQYTWSAATDEDMAWRPRAYYTIMYYNIIMIMIIVILILVLMIILHGDGRGLAFRRCNDKTTTNDTNTNTINTSNYII